jgi:hypothetical protein
MTNLNAATQALLKVNRSFLLNMTPIQAADQGKNLVLHIIRAHYTSAKNVGFSDMDWILTEVENLIHGNLRKTTYTQAVLRALYEHIPSAQLLLEGKPQVKIVRRLRNK